MLNISLCHKNSYSHFALFKVFCSNVVSQHALKRGNGVSIVCIIIIIVVVVVVVVVVERHTTKKERDKREKCFSFTALAHDFTAL